MRDESSGLQPRLHRFFQATPLTSVAPALWSVRPDGWVRRDDGYRQSRASVHQLFGVYDQIFGKIFHESREACVRNLRIRPEEKHSKSALARGSPLNTTRKNCNITGIDLSSGMLAKARQRQSHIIWIMCGSC